MPAQRKDLTLDQGTTFQLAIQYLQPDNTPVDLTGHTVALALFDDRSERVGSHSAGVDSEGHINFTINSGYTALLKTERHSYTIETTSPNGNITRLLFGVINVRSGRV